MNRMEKLMEKLTAIGANGALIHKRENIRYLTGYTGEGCLFIAGGKAYVLTDFRYTEQCAIQAPDAVCLRTTRETTANDHLAGLVKECGVKTLALETDVITHDQYVSIENALPGAELLSMNGAVEVIRQIKDKCEIECIMQAAKIACDAFDWLLGQIKPGMTEKQVQIALDYKMLEMGSEQSAFDTIACSGKNGSLPHAIPSDHKLETGELLTLDFGAQVNGYKCDMTRTIAIGEVSDELKAIYDAVLTAQQMALDAVRPGAVCGDVDAIARDYLDAKYPGAFGHGLGHGVGLFIHENPRFAKGDKTVLVPGHVVTVEPGVYIPGLGGCRIEDMVLMTEDGYINPITAPKHLVIV